MAINMYFWVSGYADCSIGIGHLLGFSIPENFNFGVNQRGEFWRARPRFVAAGHLYPTWRQSPTRHAQYLITFCYAAYGLAAYRTWRGLSRESLWPSGGSGSSSGHDKQIKSPLYQRSNN
jgi:hypothetical protein